MICEGSLPLHIAGSQEADQIGNAAVKALYLPGRLFQSRIQIRLSLSGRRILWPAGGGVRQ